MTFARFNHTSISALALVAALGASPLLAQDSAGVINTAPILPNTEPEYGPVANNSGFVLSLDGQTIDADPQIEDRVRRVDVALADTDVQVQLDTLDPTPRLDVEVAGGPRTYGPGDRIVLISESNYPAYIARAEMRIFDRAAPGGPRLIETVPVQANGRVGVILPNGGDLAVVHRVYDARGRYDETRALSLSSPDARGQIDDVEEGTQFTARQGIPVNGGTVTVSATDIRPGAVLQTMGETVRPDPSGRAVIQRILPHGDHAVAVAVKGNGADIELIRPIEVPNGRWFYVAVADLTYGVYRDGQTDDAYTSATGRLQYFVEGETGDGVRIVSSLDTAEVELDEVFRRLDERDPRHIIEQMDPASGYPTYGDDSTIKDLTPTSGKLYVRIEKDNSFLVWGDYRAKLDGNSFLRNERTLYGLQAHHETRDTTTRGEPVAEADIYLAQPDQLVGRDVFRGSGGSVYFLRRQGITDRTETVTVEVRDRATNRVIGRRVLTEFEDYQINHVQGTITLRRPLSGSGDRRLISTNSAADEIVNLIVQYEYTPTTSDVDGFSYGGRAEGWVNDKLRFGATAMQDETGVAEQRSIGVDLRYQMGPNSFVQLDYTDSKGPGYETALSDDGGLVFGTNTGSDGTGSGVRLATQLDFADLGDGTRNGIFSAYYEKLDEGFSTLDRSVTAATGDETLYGMSLAFESAGGGARYALYADGYENAVGDDRLEIGAELAANLNDRWSYELGVERLTKTQEGVSGTRTDIGARLAYAIRDDFTAYAFGQATLSKDKLRENNRGGVGLTGTFENGWEVGAEISGGDGGLGARLLANQTQDGGGTRYFGYDLDPGRALTHGISAKNNGGKFVIGGTRDINEQVSVFGENTYDIFGEKRELISAYGVTYEPNDRLSFTGTIDTGQLNDRVNGDVDRIAVSFGMSYTDEDLRAAGRVELRRDDYEDPSKKDALAAFVVADMDYRISEEARLLLSADIARTETNGLSFETGKLVDASIGYAYRPIDNERLNVLARYRYFYDNVGQEIDGLRDNGPVQESHVLSVEGNYDLDHQWTVGGKIGARWSEYAISPGAALSGNDAVLLIANARYHSLHKWDLLLEARYLDLIDAQSTEVGVLAAAYRQVGEHTQVGIGYNFSDFSSDLTDLTFDDEGIFINVIASY